MTEHQHWSAATIRIADILTVTADCFGVSVPLILSQRVTAAVVRPRHVAMYLARRLTTLSLTQIGRACQRDHTSVSAGVRRIEDAMADDPELRATIDALSRLLTERARLETTHMPHVIELARAIARVPRRGAIGASTDEIGALALALCQLWDIASAAETLIGDLGHCEVLAPQSEKDRLVRIQRLSAAITSEINHIAGPDRAAPAELTKEESHGRCNA